MMTVISLSTNSQFAAPVCDAAASLTAGIFEEVAGFFNINMYASIPPTRRQKTTIATTITIICQVVEKKASFFLLELVEVSIAEALLSRLVGAAVGVAVGAVGVTVGINVGAVGVAVGTTVGAVGVAVGAAVVGWSCCGCSYLWVMWELLWEVMSDWR